MTKTQHLGFSLPGSNLSWIIVVAGAFCLQAVAFAQSATRFTAVATGGEEVPPVATPATALAIFDVNAQESAMRDIVLASMLTDATAAYINCAADGVNGPVGVTLYSGVPVTIPTSGLFDFGFVLQPDADNDCGWTNVGDIVSAMLARLTYVNIQTLANPDGEVRGQIVPPGNIGADCMDPPNLVAGADLRNCDLSGDNLANESLQGANLINANLSFSELEGASLDDADLRAANFNEASLFCTEMPGADLRYAILRNTVMEGAQANNANFSRADLEGADMYFAEMNGAILNGANLKNSHITSTRLRGADLRNADMRNAFAGRPDLRDAIWGNTLCPDGTNSDDDDGDNFTCESNLSRF